MKNDAYFKLFDEQIRYDLKTGSFKDRFTVPRIVLILMIIITGVTTHLCIVRLPQYDFPLYFILTGYLFGMLMLVVTLGMLWINIINMWRNGLK